MSKSAEALIYGIRSLQRFVDALSAVESPEQVYAFGLTAIQEIFKPNGPLCFFRIPARKHRGRLRHIKPVR